MSDYPARTPMQLGWLAAAAGLVVLLLVGGGWLAWRGMSSPPVPAATAAVSPQEVGTVAFGAPELIDGVPWGFPTTLEGAAAAAAVAVSVTGHAAAVFDAERFDSVAAVVFTAGEAAAQAREVDAARVQFEVSGFAAQPPARRMYHLGAAPPKGRHAVACCGMTWPA